MTPRLSSVLSDFDLPLAELQAARLDGEVFAVDECFSPIDAVEGRVHRALALATLVPPRLIAERRSAAWVLGAAVDAPAVHELCAASTARARPPLSARVSVREVMISEGDVETIGGLRVTTPLRTALDLLRVGDEFDARDAAIVRALLEIGELTSHDCRAAAERRTKLPGKRRALHRLDALER